MVQSNGSITGTILKARFGDDVRKTSLHHSNDLTLVDLILTAQRIFRISNEKTIVLKYKDLDGDLITLSEDSDLLLALHHEAARTGVLNVEVFVDSKVHDVIRSVQQQVDQIKQDIAQLLSTVSSLDNLSSEFENLTVASKSTISAQQEEFIAKNFEAPPSPVPSERPEIPATIQPSLQEQVLSENHHAPLEEEIPLESSHDQSNHDSLNSSFIQPPPQQQPSAGVPPSNQFAPPPTSIPSFPTSNAGPPPPPPPQQQQQQQQQPHEVHQFAPPPPTPQSFQQGPPSHSSVASTPVSQQHQPQYAPPPQQYAPPADQHQQPPQNYGAPPLPPPSQQPQQQFAPPPPPQGMPGSFPPPQQQQQQQPPQQGGFAPPPNSFPPAGAPGSFAPPPPGGPGGFAPPPPPQGGPGGFAPPPAGGPGSFAPPPPGGPGSFAPPPAGGPGGFAPPPSGFAPPPSAAGGNPFARGPAFRQSPYHHAMISRKAALFVGLILTIFVIFSIFDQQPSVELIPFETLQCQKMFDGDEEALMRGANFKFNDSRIIEMIEESSDRCATFQSIFQFFTRPITDEERNFPLAYGMLVHSNFVQVSLLLSAIYQPQNQFCIAIDGKSSEQFKNRLKMLADCYPNIRAFTVERIEWCGYEILTSVFECVDYLARLESDWKYFQYLSGVDAPLKSNIEMVRILASLNGSFNAEVDPFEFYRLKRKNRRNSPLPLFKTSLSATFSRKSANFMVNSEIVRRQIEFLRGTLCADESLWATIAGNPEQLRMPGGFDAKAYVEANFRNHFPIHPIHDVIVASQFYNITSYYISRYQQYSTRPPARCKGYYYRLSCVFGVRDLPHLVRRHELVAHKLYFDFQPAAFLCLIENSRRKTMMMSTNFTGIEYSRIKGAPTSSNIY
ncbi:unnamed protein product [Caenorhabditis bovis]|uniref:PB1 domain-containing protein n=1 Tax=Caenorhabditis bovis TaxID=2654633 RepID=A0A8S1F9E5_9PELO|nr:unnamed protein product [Caenorhabditis bovis]